MNIHHHHQSDVATWEAIAGPLAITVGAVARCVAHREKAVAGRDRVMDAPLMVRGDDSTRFAVLVLRSDLRRAALSS